MTGTKIAVVLAIVVLECCCHEGLCFAFQPQHTVRSTIKPTIMQAQPSSSLNAGQHNDHDISNGNISGDDDRKPADGMDRRSVLQGMLVLPFLMSSASNCSADTGTVTTATADSATAPVVAPVTQKLTMDVRISRQDGTFYVRDDLADTPENRVFYGKLTIGLFGTVAPNNVKQFLKYADVQYMPLDENPLPSYSRSTFVSLDQSTGLLVGGSIPSLEVTAFNGGAAIKYGGRITPAQLWGEASNDQKLSHNTKGLLTHRLLDVNPRFGITTRPNPDLDGSNVVFGQILFDESSRDFLRLCEDIPTYSLERPKGDPRDETAVDVVASSIFNSQRELFRGAAKAFGDDRVSKVYPGKLLRRVEVTKVELI